MDNLHESNNCDGENVFGGLCGYYQMALAGVDEYIGISSAEMKDRFGLTEIRGSGFFPARLPDDE